MTTTYTLAREDRARDERYIARKTWREPIEDYCRKLDVTPLWREHARSGWASSEFRSISGPPPVDFMTAAHAVHELGHIVANDLQLISRMNGGRPYLPGESETRAAMKAHVIWLDDLNLPQIRDAEQLWASWLRHHADGPLIPIRRGAITISTLLDWVPREHEWLFRGYERDYGLVTMGRSPFS